MEEDFTAKAEQSKRPRFPAFVTPSYQATSSSFVQLKPSSNRLEIEEVGGLKMKKSPLWRWAFS
jgi:hypothetical protein